MDEAIAGGPGTLFLIPTPLGQDEDPLRVLPPATVEAAIGLDLFVAEHARSARAVLSRLPMRRALQEITIRELNGHTPPTELPSLLAPLLAGRSAGLLSEAGCPAVADPGAALVALAHRHAVPVRPLVGPSSLLLALMASGMNGQAFSFAGYVPVDSAQRVQRLRELERRSAANGEAVLVIETPYRNQVLFDALLESLDGETRVGVAARLTLSGESTRSKTVAQWRALRPALERTPTVFSIEAPARAHPGDGRPQGRAKGRPAGKPASKARAGGRGTGERR
ncbi:MAG TPA: SAM-dependent methyltransferase [Quisquiliibacterium sp.]|nr:SAM-dependent methyltransferase [Quisquiliibacterium sp.]